MNNLMTAKANVCSRHQESMSVGLRLTLVAVASGYIGYKLCNLKHRKSPELTADRTNQAIMSNSRKIRRQAKSRKNSIPNSVHQTDTYYRSICRIKTQTAEATGCLCELDGKRFILINNHVIRNCDLVEGCIAEFDCLEEGSTNILIIGLDSRFFYTSHRELLDYTAVGYIGDLSDRPHYNIRTQKDKIVDNMKILVYHHPDGKPMVKTKGRSKNIEHSLYFGHDARTDNGSSGGPVINREDGTLLGIHCGKDENSEIINVFTPISKIFTDLVYQIDVARSRPNVLRSWFGTDDDDEISTESDAKLSLRLDFPDVLQPFVRKINRHKPVDTNKEVLQVIRSHIRDSSPSINLNSIEIRIFGLFVFTTTQVVETRCVEDAKLQDDKKEVGDQCPPEEAAWLSSQLDCMARNTVRSSRCNYKDNRICLSRNGICKSDSLCQCRKAVSTIKELTRKSSAIFPVIQALPPEIDNNQESNYIYCGNEVEGPRLTVQHFKDVHRDYPCEIAEKAISETLMDFMPSKTHKVHVRKSAVKFLVIKTYSFVYNSQKETIWVLNGQSQAFHSKV